jgi:hypothetical protein
LYCEDFKSRNDCITNYFISELKSFTAFDQVLQRYLEISKKYENHFITTLQLINQQYYERLQKIIILK